MAAMAKVQPAGAAASIGHGADSKNRKHATITANRNRTGVPKNGVVFSSETIGTEIWIKDGNAFGIRVASQDTFTIDLENYQHFFWAG
jgi:hypothetical protein